MVLGLPGMSGCRCLCIIRVAYTWNPTVSRDQHRTQISTEHKMYLTGPESDMQSTALNQCMADCYGSNLVVLGPIW